MIYWEIENMSEKGICWAYREYDLVWEPMNLKATRDKMNKLWMWRYTYFVLKRNGRVFMIYFFSIHIGSLLTRTYFNKCEYTYLFPRKYNIEWKLMPTAKYSIIFSDFLWIWFQFNTNHLTLAAIFLYITEKLRGWWQNSNSFMPMLGLLIIL